MASRLLRHEGGAEPTLSIGVGCSVDTYSLTLGGVLDVSSADRLDAAIDAALVSGAHSVLVDLDGLEFVDSTGLEAILRASRRADGDGRLRMTRGTGEVAQLFKLTAIDLVLPFD
jgi:anti-sigma B factor antagonist